MGLYSKPDGSVLEIPDDVPEKRRLEILKEEGIASGPRTAARAAGQPPPRRSAEARARADKFEKERGGGVSQYVGDLLTMAGKGALWNFSDELVGGIGGGVEGAKALFGGKGFKGARDAAAREYAISRDVQREMEDRAAQRSGPLVSTAAEVGGSLLSGGAIAKGGAKLLGKAAQYAPGVAEALSARTAASPVASFLARSPIARGVAAGAGGGAVSAAGANEDPSNLISDVTSGATMGGILGGGFSAATRLGEAGKDFVTQFRKGNKEERAYNAIADVLNKTGGRVERRARRQAEEQLRKQGVDVIPGYQAAKDVEGQLADAASAGVPEIVADVSPQARGLAGGIARNPNLEVAGDLVAEAEQRAAGRLGRMSEQLEIALPGNTDSMARRVAIQQARKAQGAADYTDDVMTKPIGGSDALNAFFGEHSNDITRQAMAHAGRLISNTRDEVTGIPLDPKRLGVTFNAAGDPVLTKVDTMQAFDYAKRGFDAMIAGAKTLDEKRIISSNLKILKRLLGEANPEYKTALANQRDLFQKEEALVLGNNLIKRLTSTNVKDGPRQILKELRDMTPDQQFEHRLGAIDALMRQQEGVNPWTRWNNLNKTPKQQEVMKWLFGDEDLYTNFNRNMQREAKNAQTDYLLNTAKGSSTQGSAAAQEALESNPVFGAFSGAAFGGKFGAIAGAARAFGRKMKGQTDDVQELMGQILMSKGKIDGKNLSDEIARVGTRRMRREARRLRRGTSVGAGAGYLTGDLIATPAEPSQEY